jgi:deoxyribodipyrimidine photo-lyase
MLSCLHVFHVLQALGQLPALAATRPAAAAPVQLRVRGHSHSVAAMADGQTGGGARRIVLFFRNDLRLRDNVIVHQAVQKVKAGEYDEVRRMERQWQQQQQ